jgi:hypothetical protein
MRDFLYRRALAAMASVERKRMWKEAISRFTLKKR